MKYKTYETEDGHTKAGCPTCKGSEHIYYLETNGKCMLCTIEKR